MKHLTKKAWSNIPPTHRMRVCGKQFIATGDPDQRTEWQQVKLVDSREQRSKVKAYKRNQVSEHYVR